MQSNLTGTPYKVLKKVMERYERYENFLAYPGDYGERAFRGWLVFELFHKELGWPVANILFGEIFDVLLLDDDLNPRINIETKKPGDGLANYDEFIKRLPNYQTLHYGVLTDGYEWLLRNCHDGEEQIYRIEDDALKFNKYIKPFIVKKYLIGDMDV